MTLEIANDILTGKYDADLEVIVGAVKHRRETIATLTALTVKRDLKIGDHVKLNTTGLRPKYLNGALSTVKEIRDKNAGIVLDDKSISRGSGVWNIPLHCLEKVA